MQFRHWRAPASLVALLVAGGAFSLAGSITEDAFALAGSSSHAAPERTPTPVVISGNPFAWPGDVIPIDEGPRAAAPQVKKIGTLPSLEIFAGEQPFAMIDGESAPLYIGSHFQGSTVREILPFGIRLANGVLLQASSANYTTAGGSSTVPAIPSISQGFTVLAPAVSPTPAALPTPQPAATTLALPYAFHTAMPVPYGAEPVPTGSP